ncbi:MAG TPA: hypothetical protein DDY24_08830 [Alcaligenaceae bacterium]|nr:hypothetical protein [Alcaligenaceae bacterium]
MVVESVPESSIRVVLLGGFSRAWTNGVKEFTVHAKSVRGVLNAMDKMYPGMGEALEENANIAINGVIHEVVYTEPVPPGSEVFFIPRIEAG